MNFLEGIFSERFFIDFFLPRKDLLFDLKYFFVCLKKKKDEKDVFTFLTPKNFRRAKKFTKEKLPQKR